MIYLREHVPTLSRPDMPHASARSLLQWWGEKTLADIKSQSCRDYIAWRRAPTSGSQDLRILRAAVGYYHAEHGPLTAVPAFAIPAQGAPRDRWLTRSELARMLWAARQDRQNLGHVARFLLVGIYSGSRSQNILRLSWLPSVDGGHVDLEAGVIHRQPRGARTTNKRAPPVRIHARLLPFLRRWRERDLAAGITHVVHFQGQRIRKLRRSWKHARSLAGLGDDVIPHTLRHSAATWLCQAGVPVFEIAGYLGMTVEMVERVYGHHHPDFQSRAAGYQSGAVSGASGGRKTVK